MEIFMSNNVDLKNVVSQFELENNVGAYGNGHINDTYLIEPKKYILQRINTSVFPDAENLMKNIVSVTEFLKEKIIAEGGDPERETLSVIKTKDGKDYYKDEEGRCFRVYKYITDSLSFEVAENLDQIYMSAKGFAKFQQRLSDFPAENLHEIIKDFHNTPVRFKNLEKAVKEDKMGRVKNVEAEIEFAFSQKSWISAVVDGIADGSIPVRVTHNDTKINNILFDAKTKEAVCVIDLDTVMPGSMLYDFGDALRMGASTAAEDEQDLSKVSFNLDAFRAFSKGYLEEMRDKLTKREIELLPLSAKLLTYECGTRFLTDYLEGDTYFKIHREGHNLDRARTQFKLVADMTEKFDEMKSIINNLDK